MLPVGGLIVRQEYENYPALYELLGAWFHQDFDIVGDSIAAIIAAFNDVSSSAEREAVRENIARFLHDFGSECDTAFVRIFRPDIDPRGFAESTQAFLEEIAQHLANQPSVTTQT